VFTTSVVTVGSVYFIQYALNYTPCHLCLQERIPYIFAITIAPIVGILRRATHLNIVPIIFIGLCALAFAIDACLAIFHTGIEYKWWAGFSTCTDSKLIFNSLKDLQSELKIDMHVPQCNKAAWKLFGISLAGYNVFVSLSLFIFSSLSIIHYTCSTNEK
jgi:disulfide bond formation protein DsbB